MVGLVARLMLAAPPGVSDPDAVARLKIDITTSDGERYGMSTTSYPVFRAVQALGKGFTAVAAVHADRLTTGRGAEMAEAAVIAASGDYFRVLGVHPALGRFFGPEDDALPAGSAVAVLSHAYWKRRFGPARAVARRRRRVAAANADRALARRRFSHCPRRGDRQRGDPAPAARRTPPTRDRRSSRPWRWPCAVGSATPRRGLAAGVV